MQVWKCTIASGKPMQYGPERLSNTFPTSLLGILQRKWIAIHEACIAKQIQSLYANYTLPSIQIEIALKMERNRYEYSLVESAKKTLFNLFYNWNYQFYQMSLEQAKWHFYVHWSTSYKQKNTLKIGHSNRTCHKTHQRTTSYML